MLFTTIALVVLLPTALASPHRQWSRQVRRPEPGTPEPSAAMPNAPIPSGPLPSGAMLSDPRPNALRPGSRRPDDRGPGDTRPRPGSKSRYLNAKSQKFLVDGTSLPEVNFDVGESYAGNLPNSPSGDSSLFFWFFPSDNPAASNEITLWLNGGPGCSSLAGFLRENGPFLWQPGTDAPYANPYSWTNLTNVVWVDQPAGAGFSPGPSTVKNEDDLARQFLDFWRNFVDTFELHGRKVYLTGESYAGMYLPYIASHMIDDGDPKYFDIAGTLMYGPLINTVRVARDVPAAAALEHFKSVIPLNETFMEEIAQRADECGYTQLLADGLVYPPAGKLPPAGGGPGCNIWIKGFYAITDINPCFNGFHLTSFCPFESDVMNPRRPLSGNNQYFSRKDVQKAIHAPGMPFSICNTGIFPGGVDPSPPSSFELLPKLIEKTNNAIISHGMLDYQLLANATLLSIQNMTWNGAQGFQTPPVEQLYVPPHLQPIVPANFQPAFRQTAGTGYLGTAHTERGLTYSAIYLSGHEVPQYSPGAAYTQLEFLLGRIDDLTVIRDYTTVNQMI